MRTEQQTRTLLGPADPARTMTVPPARSSAAELMVRAETMRGVGGAPRPARRRVLIGAAVAVAVAAVATYPFLADEADQPPEASPPEPPEIDLGVVVVPIAYEVATDPPPAGDHLRALAAQLTDAPYDGGSGGYAYHRYQTWGGAAMASPEGYELSWVEERETWAADDGSGRGRTAILGAEFPDPESQRYWEELGFPGPPEEHTEDLPAGLLHPGTPLPSEPGQLAELLGVAGGEEFGTKPLHTLYQRYVVPREVRAQILEVLADVPGLEWRGEVTDRAGRTGVAVTFDGTHYHEVMVFDPDTGELLATELIGQDEQRVQFYGLFLETSWTDQPG